MGEPSPEESLVGRTVEHFRIDAQIGRGGMGVVYRARDERLQRDVAVKVLRGDLLKDRRSRQRFLRETRVACKVAHPYVAMVLDVVDRDDGPMLVMEYVDGRSLAEVFEASRPGREELARYGLEIAEALVAIHNAGVVHRDLKPQNVIVAADGHVKVVDFGVALPFTPAEIAISAATSGGEEVTITREGAAVGTLLYMSPEQLRGQRVDPRSDLFSLGVMLYEAISAEHPFRRATPSDSVSAILNDPPGGGRESVSLSEAGPLRDVVLRLLEKSPERRYQRAEDLVVDLRSLRHGAVPRAVLRGRLRRFAAAGVLAFTALAIGGFGWWLGAPTAPIDARPLVAVLPFEDNTGDPDGALRGKMLADLLGADLAESSFVRSLETGRLLEILEPGGRKANRAANIAGLTGAAPVRWIVAGTLYRENDTYEARMEVYEAGVAGSVAAFRVAAAGTAALVDLARAKLLRTIAPESEGVADADPAAADLTSSSEEARLLAYRAWLARREYRLDVARDFLQQALAIDPGFLAARVELASVLDVSGYAKRAREAADLALHAVEGPSGAPSPRLGLQARAVHARVHEKLEQEIQYRRALVERFSDEPAMHTALAAAIRGGDRNSEEALSIVDRAIDLDRLDPRAHVLRASILVSLGRHDDALRALDRADGLFEGIASPVGRARVEKGRGDAEYARGRFDEAAQHYRAAADGLRAAGQDVPAAIAEIDFGAMDVNRGRLDAAEATYRSALPTLRASAHISKVVDALNGLGGSFFVRGRTAEAEPHLREALGLARELDNPRVLRGPLLNLAGLLNYTGRLEEGRRLAEEGLAVARQRPERSSEIQARLLLADIDSQQGRLDDAVAAYREVIRLQESEIATQRHLGVSFAGLAELLDPMGSLAEALATADRAVETDRAKQRRANLGYALAIRASIRGQLGMWDEAEADLAEVERIAHGDEGRLEDLAPRADLTRARLALLRGDRTAARAALHRARAAAGESPAIRLLAPLEIAAAEAALQAGEIAAALESSRAAIEHRGALSYERVRARVLRAQSLAAAGRTAEAAAEARLALEEAERMGLPLATAAAAAALAGLPDEQDRESVMERGRTALQRYVDHAPADRREAVRGRADVRRIREGLEIKEERTKEAA